MFEKKDKQQLYWLIDLYLSTQIDAWKFCNEYVKWYNLELNIETLTKGEYKLFSELNTIAARFSNIEEDLQRYPGTYFSQEKLDQKVAEIKKSLRASNQ